MIKFHIHNLKFYLSIIFLSFLSFLIFANINFSYKNIFYLDVVFDENYIKNIKRAELDMVSDIPKYFYLTKSENLNNSQITWKDKCEVKVNKIRCVAINQIKFNFFSINQTLEQLNKTNFELKENLQFENFMFITDDFVRHVYETEFFNYVVFDNYEKFKELFLNNVINFVNKDITKKGLSTFYANDLVENFEKRYLLINSYNRNDLSKLYLLFYIKILIIFIFSIFVIFYLIKILFKK